MGWFSDGFVFDEIRDVDGFDDWTEKLETNQKFV